MLMAASWKAMLLLATIVLVRVDGSNAGDEDEKELTLLVLGESFPVSPPPSPPGPPST